MILRKITVEVQNSTYKKLTDNLHHGQLAALIRLFVSNVVNYMEQDKKANIMNWLYGKNNLTLHQIKDEDENT